VTQLYGRISLQLTRFAIRQIVATGGPSPGHECEDGALGQYSRHGQGSPVGSSGAYSPTPIKNSKEECCYPCRHSRDPHAHAERPTQSFPPTCPKQPSATTCRRCIPSSPVCSLSYPPPRRLPPRTALEYIYFPQLIFSPC
jgi:hypothetical protein